MTDTNRSESPLESAMGTAGPHAAEAFSTLGNETRLAILLALWEAYNPYADENAVPFSALRERVGMRDSGQFNYHLDKLEGQFVRKTGAGYELKRSGQKIVRAVISGTGIEEPTLDTTKIDFDCFLCGAPTAVTYEDEWLYHICTECEGAFAGGDQDPEGFLGGMAFDPAGFTNRSPGEMLITGWMQAFYHLHLAIEGICNECSGEMTRSLQACVDHDSDGVCDNCGHEGPFIAHFDCTVCKNQHKVPPRLTIMAHPAAVAFYYNHGFYRQEGSTDLDTLEQLAEFISEHEEELITEEPPHVRVTIYHENDTLQLTYDENLVVIDVKEGT